MITIKVYFFRFMVRSINTVTKLYAYLRSPWIVAKFYAAWEDYQHGKDKDRYRIRLTTVGFRYALEAFLNCRFEQKIHLENHLLRAPGLKWRIRFIPWTIQKPEILETAARDGFFESISPDA